MATTTKVSIQDMRDLASSRDGKCLSRAYKNTQSPLQWSCSEGHKWKASHHSIEKGTWCPTCAGYVRNRMRQIQETAHENGFTCLTKMYLDDGTLIQLRCSNGHVSVTSAKNIGQIVVCAVCEAEEKASSERENLSLKKKGSTKKTPKIAKKKVTKKTTKKTPRKKKT